MSDESEFAPDLSKLDNRYQILSELRRAQNGRTFLARHTELNRDVTIDVVRVPSALISCVSVEPRTRGRTIAKASSPSQRPSMTGMTCA